VPHGSDDQAKIYLNGKAMYKHPFTRPCTPDEDMVEHITLHKGTNVLVFKVVNVRAAWEGCIRLVERTGLPAKGIRVSLTPQ
jgi:hypothetical protein